MPIAAGQPAPDFALRANDDKEYKLSDLKGKNVVLAFYPLDFSPVCSNEHACVRDDLSQFQSLNAEVFGISVDSTWAHKAFAEKLGLKYPLLADFHPKGAVAEKYGLYLGERGITARAVVVIDKDGIVRWVKQYDIPTVPDTKEVVSVLQGLK
jgi:peroxiredoxin (alkyl hydroperoxide reductase subunit C)